MKVSKVFGTLALISMFFVGCSSPVSSSKVSSAKADKETAVVASKAKEEKKDISSKAKEENKAPKSKEEASAKEKGKVKDLEEKKNLLKDEIKTKSQTSDTKKEDDESSVSMNGVEALRARNVTTDPIYMGYFRTWHDKHCDDSYYANSDCKPLQTMKEVPSDVDILFAFAAHTPYPGSFWPTLKNEYIPELHKNGTQIVRTIGFQTLRCDDDVTSKLYKEPADVIAKTIVNEYVYKYNLDGLDIDIEDNNIGLPFKQYDIKGFEVLKEIAKLIGPNGSDKSKLLIVDTNLSGDNSRTSSPMNEYFYQTIKELKDSIDFICLQIYGEKDFEDHVSSIREKTEISNNKILIGFAFYEENANNNWEDLKGCTENHKITGLETTNAANMAKYRPAEGGDIAGIFSYAIDRDGVIEHNDTKFIHTTYPWSKELKKMMVEVRKN